MRTKYKNLTLAIIVTVIAIAIPALLLNKWFEGLFFFVCHWMIREQFPKQYHHIVPAMCRTLTSIIFFFGVISILPFDISLLSAIPICYFISWIGFVKKNSDDLEVENYRSYETIVELKQQVLELDNKLSKYDNPKQEIMDKCLKAKLSKRDTEIAIKYFYEHNTPQEIWLWLCQNKEYDTIDWDSVYKLLTRIGKKLNIK